MRRREGDHHGERIHDHGRLVWPAPVDCRLSNLPNPTWKESPETVACTAVPNTPQATHHATRLLWLSKAILRSSRRAAPQGFRFRPELYARPFSGSADLERNWRSVLGDVGTLITQLPTRASRCAWASKGPHAGGIPGRSSPCGLHLVEAQKARDLYHEKEDALRTAAPCVRESGCGQDLCLRANRKTKKAKKLSPLRTAWSLPQRSRSCCA